MSEFNTGDRVKVVDYNLELELDPGLNPIGRVGTVVPSPYDDDVYIWVVLDEPLDEDQIGSKDNPILLWTYEIEHTN